MYTPKSMDLGVYITPPNPPNYVVCLLLYRLATSKTDKHSPVSQHEWMATHILTHPHRCIYIYIIIIYYYSLLRWLYWHEVLMVLLLPVTLLLPVVLAGSSGFRWFRWFHLFRWFRRLRWFLWFCWFHWYMVVPVTPLHLHIYRHVPHKHINTYTHTHIHTSPCVPVLTHIPKHPYTPTYTCTHKLIKTQNSTHIPSPTHRH